MRIVSALGAEELNGGWRDAKEQEKYSEISTNLLGLLMPYFLMNRTITKCD